MRALRQQTARNQISKKKLHSSLATLPHTNSKNKPNLSQNRRKKRRNLNIKSLVKTPQNQDERKEKECIDKDYDSTDSLDQLLDNNFTPYKSNTHHPKCAKDLIERKNIGSVAGGKRAKALALLASTAKKKQHKAIKYTTPSIHKSRNRTRATPKHIDAFKYMDTPCTPTPLKLTANTKSLSPIPCDLSWKDVEYNTNKAPVNKVSEYDELLILTRPLPLPIKWRVLLQKFNALESTLSLYQRKNSFFVHYQNIANSVQQITKKSFSLNDLQQILSVAPDLYHVQWTANNKELVLTVTAIDYDPNTDGSINDPLNKLMNHTNEIKKKKKKEIGIRFMKISKIKERCSVFRLRLIQYAARYHCEWLTDNEMVEFDPLKNKKWHKRFDLDNVKDIPISSLPLKPKKSTNDIEKMMKEQEKKLKEIVEKEVEKAKQNDDNGKSTAIPSSLAGLSPSFIAKIRAKKKNKIVTTKRLKTKEEIELDEEQFRMQQLPYLVCLMRGIYVSSRKSSMSCNDLVTLIKKRHRNIHVMRAEIWIQLQLLDSFDSKFFKIKQGPMVKVAKLNKKISTKEVLNEIKSKTK